MSDAEMIPSIRIHVDQQLLLEAVSGTEDVEDATLATEITGFDVEDDAYVLKGALSFTGFLRQEDAASLSEEIPDVLDDRDVFEAGEDVPEAHVIPLHHRMPFVLQVPMAAQQAHQRQHGILDVNPRIGTWNAHVLGEGTIHLRAELVIHGLSGGEGYVFRCGTQEEGVAAQKLDQLLDSDESRHYEAPKLEAEEEFEPPFEPAWSLEQAARYEDDVLAEQAQEDDDWVIESPAGSASEHEAAFVREEDESAEEEENDIVFTPDPNLVFPMPQPGSVWARQLEEADAVTDSSPHMLNPFDTPPQVSFGYDQTLGTNPFTPPSNEFYGRQPFRSETVNPSFHQDSMPQKFAPPSEQTPLVADAVLPPEPQVEEREAEDDENAFVLEEALEEVHAEVRSEGAVEAVKEPVQAEQVQVIDVTEIVQTETVEQVQVTAEHQEQHEAEHHHEHHHDHEHQEHDHEDQDHHDHDHQHQHHHHGDEEDRPYEAEYQFEDEVNDAPTVQVQEQKPLVAVGPKLSVGSKHGEKQEASPIKLSALLGDSRAHAADESSSSHHQHHQDQHKEESYVHAVHESSSHHAQKYAPVHTKSHDEDSFWSDVLTSQEEHKVTMKFKIVQSEETLSGLAERYQTSVSDLQRANNLQDQALDVGQILYIPATRR